MKRRFGAHLDAKDGLRYVVVNARALGIEAFQFMLGDGRSWNPFKVSDEMVSVFRKLSYGMVSYLHLPYTINPCVGRSDERYNVLRSVVRKYMDLADALGVTAAVLHPGFKKELSLGVARTNFLHFMEEVAPHFGESRLLFETDSGSKNGSKIGSAEFISDVLEVLGRDHFGMCIDTEHLYARGVDLWDSDVRKVFLERYGSLVELVHLNAPDPAVSLGSYLDMHSTPFVEYARCSADLVRDLVSAYPAVVERRSMVVAEKDVMYVNALVPPNPSGIDSHTTEESEDDGIKRKRTAAKDSG